MRRRRLSLSSLSIRHRLPLLIGTLLLGIITASTWTSYRGVKESALELGRERLQNLTQQLATLSQQSAVALLGKTYTAANDPAIRGFLKSPSPATRPAASAILQQFTAAFDPSMQVELWNAQHSLVLSVPDGAPPEPADLNVEFRQCATDPFKAVGAMRVVKDVAAYPVVALVKDEKGSPLGYLVRWKKVSATPEARRQLTDLLGSEAELYFGNSRGDVWTDLQKVVPKPPAGLGSILDVTHYLRDGKSVMALGRPVSGTPWFIVVEFPDLPFLSQARHFLKRVILIDLLLLAVGIGGALALSRSITRPLHLLTEAASAIREGDDSRIIVIGQDDELGALGQAFNAMRVKVRDSRRELEGRIQERNTAQEAASKLAAIVECSHDAIMGKTLDGSITSWNKGAERLYGYAAEEVIGRSIAILTPAEHSGELAAILETLKRGESIDHFETERIAKGGERISVSLTISPIKDASGHISGGSTIARDITQRKQAEEARQRSEEALKETNHRLEQALAALQAKSDDLNKMTQQLWQASKLATMGELAASVAHELNNPLATVALHAESVMEQWPMGDPKPRGLEIISQEVERMASLVSNLLQFSRRSHRQVSSFNLPEELRNSLDFIEYHLRSRQISIVQDLASGLPTVQADRQQLRQVFLNLITNASDAMPSGGTLTVRAIPGVMGPNQTAVIIEFSDTGTGIQAEDLPKIWEPFFTTKSEGKGTGLGLAICRRAVEEHRGTIEIETDPGKGTTVRIALPATGEGVAVAA